MTPRKRISQPKTVLLHAHHAVLAQTCPKMWHCVKFCWRIIWHSVMMEGQERKFFATWSTLAADGASHDTKKKDQPTKNSTTTCPSPLLAQTCPKMWHCVKYFSGEKSDIKSIWRVKRESYWYLKYSSIFWCFPWHQEKGIANQKQYYYNAHHAV